MSRWLKQSLCGALLSIVFALASTSQARAVTLVPGDIAIVGFWCDATPAAKSYALVTFVDLDAGTVLSITDSGAHPDGTFRSSEGIINFMVTTPIAAGTVLLFPGDDGDLNLSTSGDQLFVFQGTLEVGTAGALTGTLLFGVNDDSASGWEPDAASANSSALPPGIDGQNLALPERDNYAYIGPTTGTRAALMAAITMPDNWMGDDTAQPAFPTSFTITTGTANGGACTDGTDCGSGFCSDSVCCASDCGNDPHDCQACSSAAGALVNGTCGAAVNTTVCRDAASACDVAETCDGTSVACPADAVSVPGTACNDETVCNGAETCDDVGECMPGTALDCDVSDPCLAPSCDPVEGCVTTPIDGCGDAGVSTDAGMTTDSGTTTDSGMTTTDSGMTTTDSGMTTSDAGTTTDASTTHDAGSSIAPPRASSCHCDAAGASTRTSTPVLFALFAALALVARRRSRSR